MYCIAEQADGKILVGGDFTTIGGLARERIARLHADGSVDASFNPRANGVVYGLVIEPDGNIVIVEFHLDRRDGEEPDGSHERGWSG